MDRPVFLVGAQRSGTTALGIAIARAIADQGGCFTVNAKLLYHLRRWCTADAIADRHLRSDEIIHSLRRVPILGADAEAWLDRADRALREAARAVAAGDVTDHRGLARTICAGAYGVDRWGDKYNEYLLDLRYLHETYPRATWIFLCRRPEACVASMLEWGDAKPWNPSSVDAAAAKWADWNQRWLDLRDDLEPSRRVEVAYEAIARGEHQELDEMLGIEMTPYLSTFGASTRFAPVQISESSARCTRAALARLGLMDPLTSGLEEATA